MSESKHTPETALALAGVAIFNRGIGWQADATATLKTLAAEVELLREENADLRRKVEALEKALRFYARKAHFSLSDADAWDTVSGEPQNYWCDDAGTATVEDGTVARAALAATEGGGT